MKKHHIFIPTKKENNEYTQNRKIDGDTIMFDNYTIYPVKITYREWFQNKTMLLFPTNQGPTFGTGKILYLDYVDSVGKKFYESEQINNYVKLNQ